MSGIVNKFKEVLHKGMIQNFEHSGFLTPIIFYIKDGEPIISMIPPELINCDEGKQELAGIMKNISSDPSIMAVGMIIEGYGVKSDSEALLSLLKNGDVQVKELNNKKDIILLLFSTPMGDELIAYSVDVENKKVCDRFNDVELGQFDGLFTNFFSWNKN